MGTPAPVPAELLQRLFAQIKQGQPQPAPTSFTPPPMPKIEQAQQQVPQQHPYAIAPAPQQPQPQPLAKGSKLGDIAINLAQSIIQRGKQKRQQQANDFIAAMDNKQQQAQQEVEFQLSQQGKTLDQVDPNQARQMVQQQFMKDNSAWLDDPKVQKLAQAFMKSKFAPLMGKGASNDETQMMQNAVRNLQQSKGKEAKTQQLQQLNKLRTMMAVKSLLEGMVQRQPEPLTAAQAATLSVEEQKNRIEEAKVGASYQESMVRLQEVHQEKAAALQQQLQLAQMRMQEMKASVEERAQAAKDANATRLELGKMMQQFHQESLSLRKELASQSGTPADWAAVSQSSFDGIKAVPPKDRAGVVKFLHGQGQSIPQAITPADQKVMEQSDEFINEIPSWIEQVKMYGTDPKTGQLSNDPGYFRQAIADYKLGNNEGAAGLLGALSRADWMMIGPLLHGTRNASILRDIKAHTPKVGLIPGNIDSPALMVTKMQSVLETYRNAKSTIYNEHGFTNDPTTGKPLIPPAGVVISDPSRLPEAQ